MQERTVVVGVDIGGTFTDFVAIDRASSLVAVHKEPTTPREPEVAVIRGLGVLLEKLHADLPDVNAIVHGTTLATNLLVERKGDQIGLVTTRGFGDVIEIARERRFDPYSLAITPPQPLVSPAYRREITERTSATGVVEVVPTEEEIAVAVRELTASGVRSLAVSLLFAPSNPSNENLVRSVCATVDPELYVSISSDVDGGLGEYERTSTTAINAYIQPTLSTYLSTLDSTLREAGYRNQLFVMLSSGGVARAEVAREFPVRFVESGPVGGVMATASLASRLSFGRVVAFDMGGTTAKIAVINDFQPEAAKGFEVARVEWHRPGSGLPARSPILELIEIGLGGGSIARVDGLGSLAVGPDSAGASPGPACYQRGGTMPTTTDADLLLGYIDPDRIAGGTVSISTEAASAAVGRLAESLNMTELECAWAIHRLANEEMAISARLHLMERGYYAGDYTLVACGGAGPVHAYRLAEILDMERIVYPPGAGVLSALGFVTSPISISVFRSDARPLADLRQADVVALHGSMQEEAAAECIRAGVDPSAITFEWFCRASCQGQRDELEIALGAPADGDVDTRDLIANEFERKYRSLFSIDPPAVPLQVLGWRIVASGPEGAFEFARDRELADAVAEPRQRQAFFPEAGGWVDCPVKFRWELSPGTPIVGPMIIDEEESTLIIGPGWSGTVDGDTLCLIVERERER